MRSKVFENSVASGNKKPLCQTARGNFAIIFLIYRQIYNPLIDVTRPTLTINMSSPEMAVKSDMATRAMSALGHKQTCAVQRLTSALPLIATPKADFPQKSCPLYTQKADMCGARHHV